MPTDTPLQASQTIHPNNEKETTPTIEYSEGQKTYINFRRQRLIAARDVRNTPKQEWDDMPFLTYYDILKKADDQYIEPRRNAQDTAINLGTIRDKDTSLVEYAHSHDFEPVAQVFDDNDDMVEELAETSEDLIRKSLLMEEWRDKAKRVYRSTVAFGTALVEDAWIERWISEKTMSGGYKAGIGSEKAQWDTRMIKQYDGCQAKLWDLRKCYFGDIRKFDMNGPQGQPYFFTVEYISYDIAKQIFGNWDRFKYVPTQIVMTPEVSNASVYGAWWTIRPISNDYVEVVKYYDPIANEFAITLNGVDMLPIMSRTITVKGIEKELISGFPLTEVSPSGAIPFAKYDLEPMHDFAYSKSQPAKMRVSAAVENMMVKAFIGMFKQKWKPTMGNKSGRQFGAEVTDPATVINDIREGDLFPVLPNYQGAQPADFSFFEIMKKELDKNSVERSWQGMDNTSGAGPQPGDDTATKDMNDLKAQSLKIASLFDGIISGNKQLYWLRTFNIQRNWTKPIDVRIDSARKVLVNKYRSVSLSTEVQGGQKATKKIMFTTDMPDLKKGRKYATLDDSFAIEKEELDYKKAEGKDMRFVRLHPQLYATAKMSWYYTCIPVPNGSDPLSYMMFAKQINDAAMMFGPESLNVKRLKHKFAALTGQDYDTWFIAEAELEAKQQQAANAEAQATAAGAKPSPVPGKKINGAPSPAGPSIAANPAAKIGAMMK